MKITDKNLKLVTIPISEIDESDKRFRIRADIELKTMISSIKKIGLISPLILIQKKSTRLYTIISGFRRYHALKKNKINLLKAYIIINDWNEKDLFNLVLSEFLSHNQPNVIEKSIIIKKLEDFYNQNTIVNKYFPLLNLSLSQHIYERTLPLSRLSKKICKAIIQGQIHQDIGLILARLDVAERKLLFNFLVQLNFSVSNQFKLVEILMELSKRDDCKISEIILDEKVNKILADSNVDQKKRSERILNFLKERRHPLLTKAVHKFEENRRQIHLPPEISFTPPPFFEGPNYRINFQFKNLIELQKRLKELEKISMTEALKKILQ
ncbi:MAG: ParB N-terminal domain-containing protein [bacterium]